MQKKLVPYILIFLGAILRLFNINTQSLRLDEGYTILTSKQDLLCLLLSGSCDDNPPLGALIYKLWGSIFGFSKPSLEIVSVIFGVASLFYLWKVALKLYDEKTALWCLLIATLSSYHVLYSQFMRVYSLGMFLTLLSILYLLKLKDNPKNKNKLIYLLTITLLLYTHYFAGFIVLAELIYVIRYRIKFHWILFIILALPLLKFFYQDYAIGQNYIWLKRPVANVFASIWYQFSSESFVLLIIYLSFLIYSLRKNFNLLLVLVLFIPIIGAVIASLIGPSVLHVRYFIFSFPAFALLTGRGITMLQNQKVELLVLVLFSFCSGLSLANYYKKQPTKQLQQFNKEDIIAHTSKCSYVPHIALVSPGNHYLLPNAPISRVIRCTKNEKRLTSGTPTSIVDVDCYPHRRKAAS